jgi:hypothetical protein
MSTVTPKIIRETDGSGYAIWSGIVTGDTIVAAKIPTCYPHKTVAVTGTFAGGTSVGLTGSMDNSTFLATYSAGGSVAAGSSIASVASAGDAVIAENFRYWKPTIASGSADSITVTITFAE